ncbi:Retinol dehydrogenase 12 [Halotydeus destructor]|nr:Retinol dehydrogenase 12 [Halotydeus destructor]
MFTSVKFISVLATLVTTCAIGAIFVARWWLRRGRLNYLGKEDMTGKVVIITGSNTGIGKEAARLIADRKARIILAVRDVQSGHAAAKDIMASTGNGNIVVKECNLASLTSVRIFVEDIITSEERLDVLICNAGAGAPMGRHLTEDGFEMQFQVNHLGHFLLVNLLGPLIKQSSPSRVIITSSSAHRFGKLDLANFARSDKYVNHPFWNYCDTKLANVVLAKELARRWADNGVDVNALHPGTIYTNGIRHNKIWYVKWLLMFLTYLYNKSEVEGAQTIVHLAMSAHIVGTSGQYFVDCVPATCNPLADDVSLGARLWQLSADCANLKANL